MRLLDSRRFGFCLGCVICVLVGALFSTASALAFQTNEVAEFHPPARILPSVGFVAGTVVDPNGIPLADTTVVFSGRYLVRGEKLTVDNQLIRRASRCVR